MLQRAIDPRHLLSGLSLALIPHSPPIPSHTSGPGCSGKAFTTVKIHLYSAAVVAFASSAASGQSQPVQWRVEDGGNGHWYRRELTARTWPDAQAFAQSAGAYLATPTSADENSFIFTVSGGAGNTWIGGRQSPGSCEPGCGWQWVTGETWSFTAWQEIGPQPDNTNGNENHLAYWGIEGGPGRWNDGDGASAVAPFTIEWSADCNNDGIVDYGQCRDGSLPDYNGNNIPDCCETGTPCEVGSYPVQWRVEDGGNGHWYLAKRWESPKTWEDARSSAAQMGGHLACVTTAAENQFIYERSNLYQPGCANGQEGWHLGGYQDLSASDYSEPAGGWRWISGEPWSYTAWLTGVPGGDRPNNFGPGGERYLKMSEMPYAPRWDDVGVGSSQLFMCGAIIEWSADCNGDGIVDYGQILSGQLSDANSNGVPDTCEAPPCPADVNGNGQVNGVDLAAVLGAWGTNGQGEGDADINNDGIVNGQDLAFVLGSWGPCSNVPAWATLIEFLPNPAVVTNPTLRADIAATGLPWRVRDTATQIEMLLVPPGTFQMGCIEAPTGGQCDSSALPVHQVTITQPYYLGRYEVTQAQWTARMGSNPALFQNASPQVPASQVPNRPIERVSWNSIAGAGSSFMSLTGLRLPTEAEWEYVTGVR